jgi:hypothetical protein
LRRFTLGALNADDGQTLADEASHGFGASQAAGFDRVPERRSSAFSWRTDTEGALGFGATVHAPLSPGSGASSSGSPTNGISKDPALVPDIAAHLQNGSLSYNSVLTILQDAASGGMTASKFAALWSFASELNASGGGNVSPYVQQIADDVIDGNSANATGNGGASTATRLGNLSAASSQTQADDLIGELFLGENLPSLSLAAIGEANLNPTYQNSTLPLYGPSGAPTYQDVNQGYVGDCYFVSSLGEIALKDPSAIENMISAMAMAPPVYAALSTVSRTT